MDGWTDGTSLGPHERDLSWGDHWGIKGQTVLMHWWQQMLLMKKIQSFQKLSMKPKKHSSVIQPAEVLIGWGGWQSCCISIKPCSSVCFSSNICRCCGSTSLCGLSTCIYSVFPVLTSTALQSCDWVVCIRWHSAAVTSPAPVTNQEREQKERFHPQIRSEDTPIKRRL